MNETKSTMPAAPRLRSWRPFALALTAVATATPFALCQEGTPQDPETPPESAPANPESLRTLGAEFLRMGRRADAIEAFQSAFALDGAVESGLGWARALLADGKWNDALRALDAVKDKHPKSPEVFLALAEAQAARAEARRREGADPYTVAAEYEAAARWIQDALEVKPDDLDLYFGIVRYLTAAGKAGEAAEIVTESRKSHPKAWQLALCEGDARLSQLEAEDLLLEKANADEITKADRKEKLDATIAAFNDAIRLAPDRAEPLARMSTLLLRSGGDKVKARELVHKSLVIDPRAAAPGPLLAILTPKESVAFFEEALRAFAKAHPGLAADDPRDAAIHWYLGYSKYLADDRKGAEEEFGKVVKKTPEDMTARYYLGKIAYLDKRYKQATEELDTIARRSPKDLAAVGGTDSLFRAILGGLVEKLIVGESGGASVTGVAGNPNLAVAIRLQRAVVEFDPSNAVEWNNLGLFLRDAGQAKEALAAYKKALELTPQDPRVLNDTAVIYHYYLRTNDAEARRLYEESIRLAKEILASKTASAVAKADARSALQDAESNLRKLVSNVRKND